MLSRARILLLGANSQVGDQSTEGLGNNNNNPWRNKWQGLIQTLKRKDGTEHGEDTSKLDPRFSLMLNLYAHHPVVDDLRALYQHKPAYVLFLLAQLCNFWLNGQSTGHNAENLEAFLLEQCRNSNTIAQRIMWFLLAHGKHEVLPATDQSGGADTFVYDQHVRELARKVIEAGSQSVEACEVHSDWVRLKPWLFPNTPSITDIVLAEDDQSCDSRGIAEASHPDPTVEKKDTPSAFSPSNENEMYHTPLKNGHSATNYSKFVQESRNTIDAPTGDKEVKQETKPASSFTDSPEHATTTSDSSKDEPMSRKEKSDFVDPLRTADAEKLENNEEQTCTFNGIADSSPSPARRSLGRGVLHKQLLDRSSHIAPVTHHHQRHVPHFGVRPLNRIAAGPPHVVGTPPFRWSESFYAELANISVQLKEIPEPERNLALRISLSSLCNDFFPSSTLALPVKSSRHSIISVVTEETFCFKTKERVPYMVCFEIIDHDLARGHDMDEENTSGLGASTGLLEWSDKLMDTMEFLGAKLVRHRSHDSGRVEGYNRVEGTPGLGRDLSRPHARSSSSPDLHRESRESPTVPAPVSNTRPRSLSGELQRARSGSSLSETGRRRSVDETESGTRGRNQLGQFAPVVENPVRGAGYDHFTFHKHLDSQHKRNSARTRAKNQLLQSPAGNLHKTFSWDSLNSAGEEGPTCRENVADAAKAQVRFGLLDNSDTDSVYSEQLDDMNLANGETVIFRERWADKENRIRATSPLGTTPGWRLVPMIVKSGDDLRQEQFASQLIKHFSHIFQEEGLPLYVRAYDVLAISPDAGLIEAVPDTISLDSLRKNDAGYISLKDFFARYYGSGSELRKARRNFCSSLAAYCIICYLLQIKDRHNGNLLLHADGHIIHIDFGFMLSNAPGNVNFETAPFKLTTEFVQLLGGPDSALFGKFRSLCIKGYLAARRHREQIILMVEMMLSGNESLPCFYAGGNETVDALRSRFNPQLNTRQCKEFVDMLIDTSLDHWRTRWYDQYQRCCVGIL